MDFQNMTGTGMLALIFSALEPPVAISLACVPYLRTLLGGRWAAHSSRQHSKYGLSGHASSFSKSGRLGGSQPLASRDDDSEVHLRPMRGAAVESGDRSERDLADRELAKKGDIRVETRWEVSSGV